MQILSSKYRTWPRNIQTLSKEQYGAHPLSKMPPRSKTAESALQGLRGAPNSNIYSVAKKHHVNYKTLSSAWSRIKVAKVQPKQYFSLSEHEMDCLEEGVKREYSIRGPLTTDNVIKLAVKNRKSDFKTYPSRTWMKNNIYSDVTWCHIHIYNNKHTSGGCPARVSSTP